MNWNDFSFASYRRLIALVRNRRTNLQFRDFRGVDSPERFFILRHDIDFSPRAALRMAEIEAEQDVRAVYFLLLGADDYNLLSASHRPFPRALAGLGHEVGLHYDVRAYPAGRQLMERTLREEIAILSDLSGQEVRAISLHCPSLQGDDPFRDAPDLINAYDSRFTTEIAYYSDSCGAWRDNAVDVLGRDDGPPRVQLLVHPLFWDIESRTRWDTLSRFFEDQASQMKCRATEVRQGWINHSGRREHDRRESLAEVQ